MNRIPIEPGEACVLVVEDSVESYSAIGRLLIYSGVDPVNCDWKASGLGVVQFAKVALPRVDLILLDIGLPHVDGYEVLKQIRATERLKDALIVAVTGHTSVEEMRRAQSNGFDGFLGKPLDAEKFPGQLADILKGNPVWALK